MVNSHSGEELIRQPHTSTIVVFLDITHLPVSQKLTSHPAFYGT
jgi:hypothetical protein